MTPGVEPSLKIQPRAPHCSVAAKHCDPIPLPAGSADNTLFLAEATLLVVREALIGCTLSEAALRQAVWDSSGSSPGGSDECMAEQAVLDAVVALLDADGFG